MASVNRSQSILLGFPRIGSQRELKKALESFWSGSSSSEALLRCGQELRQRHWLLQKQAGVEYVPCNDFSFYDHVLDTVVLLGLEPQAYTHIQNPLERYFAMARGERTGKSTPALEMTKWFDTNYHYLVPQLNPNMSVQLNTQKIERECAEAWALGCKPRVCLLGPLTFLTLSKGDDRWDLLPKLIGAYEQLLTRLGELGVQWVQWDEPALCLDSTPLWRAQFQSCYSTLFQHGKRCQIQSLLTSGYGPLEENLCCVTETEADVVHVDMTRAAHEWDALLTALKPHQTVCLGLVDGRNIWKNDLDKSIQIIQNTVERLGENRVWVGSSCSLIHVPVDLDLEKEIDPEYLSWLSFAKQKTEEICFLSRVTERLKKQNFGWQIAWDAVDERTFKANKAAVASRKISTKIHNPKVKERLATQREEHITRKESYDKRKSLQEKHLDLPPFPTTTIGSFPQTPEVRKARAQYKKGELTDFEYEAFLKKQIAEAITFQESIQIDVLVHGEFERNDMVEYFGEQLKGFLHTSHGWVQSYGSRCVKPPVICGDVERPAAMTVGWTRYAQDLTAKPVKGMLTGPVTLLQWAFVRDDLPRQEVCAQLAWAVRDEVCDLEKAGIQIIQIDEPAFREGLPLRNAPRRDYLEWAVKCFRIASCGVKPTTQIHTHMCYSEFNDIMPSIAALDADVISIETSRSQMELLNAFVDFKYPNDIGPGVYDIHSPRIPPRAEMGHLLEKALNVLDPKQIWVNPDCGLKTRTWAEVKPALQAMVAAAQELRATPR